MNITDLWTVYEQAAAGPDALADAVLIGLGLFCCVLGFAALLYATESFLGGLCGAAIGAFVGFVLGGLCGYFVYSVGVADVKADLVDSVQQRVWDEYQVELPADAIGEVVFYAEPTESYEAKSFISTVEGEKKMIHLDYDENTQTITIATDSPSIKKNTNLDVLTDH